MSRVVRGALRVGMRRGLVEGNRAWLAVGTAALGIRVVQWLARDRPVIVTEELAPGETIVVEHLPPAS